MNELMDQQLEMEDVPAPLRLSERIENPPEIPKDWGESRTNYARAAFLRYVQYITAHEIAHVVRYRVQLLRRETRLGFIDERHASEIIAIDFSSDSHRLRQNIEFDADFHGIDLMIASWMERREAGVEAGSQEPIDHDVATSELFLHSLGVVLVHMLLDLEHREIRTARGKKYPAAVHRATRSASTCERAFRDEFKLKPEVSMSLHDDAWGEVSIAARGLQFPPGRWHGETTENMHNSLFEELADQAVEYSR